MHICIYYTLFISYIWDIYINYTRYIILHTKTHAKTHTHTHTHIYIYIYVYIKKAEKHNPNR